MSGYGPEVGPDGRERPRYGEYASPEEQRARIQQPDVTEALEAGMPATSVVASDAAPPARVAGQWGAAQQSAPAVAAAPARPRLADRIATIALLAYGLFSVVTSLPALFDYEGYARTMLGLLGVDATLSDPVGARPWGIAAGLVLIVGWVLTALVSWTRLRAGRLTWWIPLVAGVVFNLSSAILALVPIMNDPVVWSALQGSVGGG